MIVKINRAAAVPNLLKEIATQNRIKKVREFIKNEIKDKLNSEKQTKLVKMREEEIKNN